MLAVRFLPHFKNLPSWSTTIPNIYICLCTSSCTISIILKSSTPTSSTPHNLCFKFIFKEKALLSVRFGTFQRSMHTRFTLSQTIDAQRIECAPFFEWRAHASPYRCIDGCGEQFYSRDAFRNTHCVRCVIVADHCGCCVVFWWWCWCEVVRTSGGVDLIVRWLRLLL